MLSWRLHKILENVRFRASRSPRPGRPPDRLPRKEQKTKKETLIEINGLVIKTNSIYKVIHKPDSNAPDGFIKEGATKLPSVGIGNTISCRFITLNKAKGTGIYDTGFYDESPCYSTKDSNAVRRQIETLKEHIVVPYEKKYGKGVLSHQNLEFWDSFGVDLYEGRYFVTSNIDDLIALYIAMTSYQLTPKGKEGDPKYSNAQYCVEDKEKVQTIKSERANLLVESISNFGALKENRNTLLNTLRYLDLIGVSDKIDDSSLNSLFYEWLNKNEENPKKFDKVYTMLNDEKTSEVINLYSIVSKLATKNVIKRISGNYYYNDELLGADLKTAAFNLNSKKELEETKIRLIEL